MVHVGTNHMGKCSEEVWEAKFRLLGRKHKVRTPKVSFVEEVLVTHGGQAELR